MELLRAGATAIGIDLGFAQIEQFRRYYKEMAVWNARMNLTTVTEWKEVQTRHFLDSLTVSLAIPQAILEYGRFLDVGSGAGFPGVPLKIAFPESRATLIDSTAKKTAFLLHLRDELGLEDVDVRTGRAETLAHDQRLRGGFDFVVARAVASLAALVEWTLPFCRIGGIVVAQKKSDVRDETARARRATATMGGKLREIREVSFKELGEVRSLVVLEKNSPTPELYPRRPGMPAKRPL